MLFMSKIDTLRFGCCFQSIFLRKTPMELAWARLSQPQAAQHGGLCEDSSCWMAGFES